MSRGWVWEDNSKVTLEYGADQANGELIFRAEYGFSLKAYRFGNDLMNNIGQTSGGFIFADNVDAGNWYFRLIMASMSSSGARSVLYKSLDKAMELPEPNILILVQGGPASYTGADVYSGSPVVFLYLAGNGSIRPFNVDEIDSMSASIAAAMEDPYVSFREGEVLNYDPYQPFDGRLLTEFKYDLRGFDQLIIP